MEEDIIQDASLGVGEAEGDVTEVDTVRERESILRQFPRDTLSAIHLQGVCESV